MREGNMLVQVYKKLKEIDTILYEVERDYRVSGFPMDNEFMRRGITNIDTLVNMMNNRLTAIQREAKKNHVTGE